MHLLYILFIYPLETFMKLFLEFSHSLTNNYGLSIILLSIAVNIALLPLYYMAEKWRKANKQIQDKILPEIKNIKKYYKGNERHFYIQAMYKIYNYHPLSNIKASVGFLIQIPFFFAAFHLLSNYPQLNGISFGILKDLGSSDGLIDGINLLPFIMTLVNIASALVYTKDMDKSSKIQLYSLSAIFLVVLYNEPAGLLLYWTMNNIFSFIKNMAENSFGKIVNYNISTKIINRVIFSFIVMIFIAILYVYIHNADIKYVLDNIIMYVIIFLTISIISFLILFQKIKILDRLPQIEKIRLSKWLFFIPLFMIILLPTLSIISSSNDEFKDIDKIISLFLFIFIVLYFTIITTFSKLNNTLQNLFLFFGLFFIIYFITNYYIFSGNYGIMDFFVFHSEGIFDNSAEAKLYDNTLVIFLLLVSFVILYKINFKYIYKTLSMIGLIFVLIFANYIYQISIRIDNNKNNTSISKQKILEPKFYFSKNGKNVLVIFFDRFSGGYIPDILKDEPQLKHELAGFTWYPNTVSFGTGTPVGLPPIYGGYKFADINKMINDNYNWNMGWEDVKSSKMTQRFETSINFLLEKFSKYGYYSFVSDPSFLTNKQMKKISNGKYHFDYLPLALYVNKFYKYNKSNKSQNYIFNTIKGYLLPFSIFKNCSPSIRQKIYNHGRWLANDSGHNTKFPLTSQIALTRAWPHISNVSDTIKGSYNFVSSNITHNIWPLLQSDNIFDGVRPKHIPKSDYKRFKTKDSIMHFYMAKEALKRASNWFKWLKKKQIYDNTKIIIVADHGTWAYNPMLKHLKGKVNYGQYHPVLIVKDFNTIGELKIDNTFMTHADVPYLALKDIEKDVEKYKYDKSKGIRLYTSWKDKKILKVYDNIFEQKNWIYK